MHQYHGWLTTVAAAIAAILWPGAAAVTIAAMLQLPTSSARGSLIIGDLWLLVGAMTATVCSAVGFVAERHRKTFFEYGYLTAMADAKASGPISINTKGTAHRTDAVARRGA